MFILQSIKLAHHPVLGDVVLDFVNADNDTDNGLVSVIIGRNGIGKSYLLSAIVHIFKTIEQLVEEKDEKLTVLKFQFSIVYLLDGHTYQVSNLYDKNMYGYSYRSFECLKDNVFCDKSQIQLPQTIIASSMTIADKYPTPSVGRYKYRGVRSENTPSVTGTRTYIRKAVDGIMDSLTHKYTTRNDLASILSELGFQNCLELEYGFRYRNVFLREDMNPVILDDIFTHWQKYFKGRTGEVWGSKYYLTLKKSPDKIEIVCAFLRQSTRWLRMHNRHNLVYDIFDLHNTLFQDYEAIKLLSNLDIITFPKFKVFKEQNGYDFVYSSSGETQQLCQFISVMSAIQSNSLILIDEPENSSHPNWQISYINWLRKIFRDYDDCHFIIATHSHFILSDLQPEWASIVALDREDDRVINKAQDVNTFCWSSDDILYRVFHVRNTRNYVFESQMVRLLDYVQNRQMYLPEAQEVLSELKTYVLNQDDPLNKLISKAEEC